MMLHHGRLESSAAEIAQLVGFARITPTKADYGFLERESRPSRRHHPSPTPNGPRIEVMDGP
jgi:hypothetical protein